MTPHQLKAIDFALDPPDGMTVESYFVVCVNQATAEDRALEAQVKASFPHLAGRGLLQATGPLVPRLLCCPDGTKFSPTSLLCEPRDVVLFGGGGGGAAAAAVDAATEEAEAPAADVVV